LTSTIIDAQHELEEPFRLLVENSDDILTVRDADGRIRYTNPSFYRHLGYRQEEVVGSTCFDLLHPEDRAGVLAALEELKKSPGARGSVRCRALHADGSWGTYEIVAHNMLDHPVLRGLVINGRDVGPRQQQAACRTIPVEEAKLSRDDLNYPTGILCICASCKKIRDDSGHWQQVETYFRGRSQIEFSHGLCAECVELWSQENDRD
jgi:PAS domain S-box-containing protein